MKTYIFDVDDGLMSRQH